MEMNVPRLPSNGHYAARWKQAKQSFKAATGKKKPAPTTKTKVFSDKIATIEKRQGTGIDKAIVTLEKLLPGAFENDKGRDAYEAAFDDFERNTGEYVQFLETAIKTAPSDVSPQTWTQAVLALKVETRRIKLELRAYLDKAKASDRAKELARQTAANMLENLAPMVAQAEHWVLARLQEKQINDVEFTGNGQTYARNITQRLMNIHKLPILVGGWQSGRGPVPDDVEDTLDAFANGRRTYTTWNEYVKELNEYRLALIGLSKWLKA
jgi:hypothetical protein